MNNILDEITEPITDRVATGLSKIAMALRSRAWQEAGARGLTPTQGQILMFLRLQPDQSSMLSSISTALGISDPTACEAVRVLERKQFLRKVRSKSDARIVANILTHKGRKEAERTVSWQSFLATAVESLSLDEQEGLLRGLVKTIRALQEQGDIPVSHMCVTCNFFRPNVHNDPERPHHCAFVDAAFGDKLLRIECAEYQPATPDDSAQSWNAFLSAQKTGKPID
jgi:DNA-binding MarR family transcriptional regulator